MVFKILKKLQAKKFGVPFRKREWYNYRAMAGEERANKRGAIQIFDKNGRYIDCPEIGGFVIYQKNGEKYKYKIVGFENESRNRDYLYDSDYIHPIIEFICKMK